MIVLACVIAFGQWASHFPMPSPLIQPVLPPKLRWPSEQVALWVEAQNYDPSFLAFFARDPERNVPPGKNIVSPADGVLVSIPRENGISYFTVGLSFWDVHVVRTPVSGVVTDIAQEGLVLFRDSPEGKYPAYLMGKNAPVQQIVTLDTDYGEVRVRLITSYWASRLKVWVKKGDRLEKGQRIGRILLGSTVVAEFKGDVPFIVEPRQRIVGGETIIFDGERFP
jgi:phosphatidylserine decarboxylase